MSYIVLNVAGGQDRVRERATLAGKGNKGRQKPYVRSPFTSLPTGKSSSPTPSQIDCRCANAEEPMCIVLTVCQTLGDASASSDAATASRQSLDKRRPDYDQTNNAPRFGSTTENRDTLGVTAPSEATPEASVDVNLEELLCWVMPNTYERADTADGGLWHESGKAPMWTTKYERRQRSCSRSL